MGRPKLPLIDRGTAIAMALTIIDEEGLDALSIRRLGKDLGVNGASLYHHFKDKEEILDGVRRLILVESDVTARTPQTTSWQDHVTKSLERYRAALLRHPNASTLMTPSTLTGRAQAQFEYLMSRMVDDGVPVHLAFAILDSAETLAFGSALINPQQLRPQDRLEGVPPVAVPTLQESLRTGARTAERLFRLELRALLAGWSALIAEEKSAETA